MNFHMCSSGRTLLQMLSDGFSSDVSLVRDVDCFLVHTFLCLWEAAPQQHFQARRIHPVDSEHSPAVKHPEMAIVTGAETGLAWGDHVVPHDVTTLQTGNILQLAFTDVSEIASSNEVHSIVWRDVCGIEVSLRICQQHGLHAPAAEHLVTKPTVQDGDTSVLKAASVTRHGPRRASANLSVSL